VAGGAVIVVGALAGVSLVGAGDRSSSAIAERASRLAAVNGDEQVGYDDGVVSTPCFSFTQPDIGTPWMLVASTRGCAVALMPRGGDMLTEFHVRGRTGSGTVEDVLNDAVVRARDAGEPVERAEVVVIAGATSGDVPDDQGRPSRRHLPRSDPGRGFARRGAGRRRRHRRAHQSVAR
jgi:hypothetical protein